MDLKTVTKVEVRKDENGVIKKDETEWGEFFVLNVEFEDGSYGIARAKKEDPAWSGIGTLVDVTTPGGTYQDTDKPYLKIRLPDTHGGGKPDSGGFTVTQSNSGTSTSFSRGRIAKPGEPSVDEKISTQASVNHASQVVMNDPFFKANGVTDSFTQDVFEVANKLKEVRDAIIENRDLKEVFLRPRPVAKRQHLVTEESPF